MKHPCILFLVLSCSLTGRAELVTKAVEYSQSGTPLEGFLAYDDTRTAQGKRPGVLVIQEWWGLNDFIKEKAKALAELGYVAFAADMYGKGKVTTDAKQAGAWSDEIRTKSLMFGRANAGLDQLMKTGLVDEAKLGAIGFCFGGSATQVLAYGGANLAGIVSFHGNPVAPPSGAKSKAKFLICNGAVDPFIKPEEVETFLRGLNEAGIDYQFIDYSGAKHAFTNPGVDELGKANGLDGIRYNRAAAERSWAHMKLFFQEIFGE
jgi:dienelactone hydrolase